MTRFIKILRYLWQLPQNLLGFILFQIYSVDCLCLEALTATCISSTPRRCAARSVSASTSCCRGDTKTPIRPALT